MMAFGHYMLGGQIDLHVYLFRDLLYSGQKISKNLNKIFIGFNKGPVIIYDRGGGRRKLTFYAKIFQGPLGLQTKHFAAHSTSCDNFSTPTLGKNN